jgi:hypothetical protein
MADQYQGNDVKMDFGHPNTRAKAVQLHALTGASQPVDLERFFQLNSPEGQAQLLARAKQSRDGMLADPNTPDDLREIIQKTQFISDLPKGERAAAIRKTGTASFPVLDCGYIIVGSFGSIWYDCTWRGKGVRVAFDPDGPPWKYNITPL